jgi:hypothetical protein
MGKVSKARFAKLGEVGQSGGAIITGANLRRPPKKKTPDHTSDPLGVATPDEALASALAFLEGLKASKGEED